MQASTHPTIHPHSIPHDTAQARRVRAEYVDMPGLNLTLPQAARLFGIGLGDAQDLLSEMVDEHFLERDATGLYRRRGCRHCW